MSTSTDVPRLAAVPDLDIHELRQAIQAEYAEVALHPTKGFHFHTGCPLARMLGYANDWLAGISETAIESLSCNPTSTWWMWAVTRCCSYL